MIPIGDYPNPPGTPWMTRLIVAANVVIFLFISLPMIGKPLTQADLQKPDYQEALHFYAKHGVEPRDLTEYQVYTFIHGFKPGAPSFADILYSMFLHGGWLHIIGNMIFLWVFGDNVEARLGKVGYTLAYFATGVLATLSYSALAGASMIPTLGASGAIAGVLGFYLIWYPFNQIRLLILFIFIFVAHVRAFWVLLFYFLIWENILPLITNAGGNVAYGAHVGGFLSGMLGAWLIDRIRGRKPAPRPAGGSWTGRRSWKTPPQPVRAKVVPDPGKQFEDAVLHNRMEDGAYSFARLAREGGAPPQPHLVFRLGHWLYENDFTNDAAAVFRYYLKNYPTGEDLDRVHLGLGILLSHRLGRAAAAREHFLTAIELADENSSIAETAREELRRIDDAQ